jgi:hypothetical protein
LLTNKKARVQLMTRSLREPRGIHVAANTSRQPEQIRHSLLGSAWSVTGRHGGNHSGRSGGGDRIRGMSGVELWPCAHVICLGARRVAIDCAWSFVELRTHSHLTTPPSTLNPSDPAISPILLRSYPIFHHGGQILVLAHHLLAQVTTQWHHSCCRRAC